MNFDKTLKMVRPLASVLACASLPISILGATDGSRLSYFLVPTALGGLISFIYLNVLARRPWILYALANILTLWTSLSLIVIFNVVHEPITWSDLWAVPVLAGIGSLALYRQVILAILIFVGLDRLLLWLLEKKT